ncbi:hypothetical protein CDAR_476271 [Caerostris darwini]|uniref:Uncharacterized protein n=1 Tax=Caerostris darwini TaxID=1538125 RepID=A0AAV4TL96_9ARAC|nr:hypothetical protein CDAR_476271 [Caerostris darwini]
MDVSKKKEESNGKKWEGQVQFNTRNVKSPTRENSYFLLTLKVFGEFCEKCFSGTAVLSMCSGAISSCAGDVEGNFSSDNFRFEFIWGLRVVDVIFGFFVRKLKATENSCCVVF